MPDRHITIAIVTVHDGLYVTATLYYLPVAHLDDLVDAFDERGPWDEETAFAALREGIGREATWDHSLFEGDVADLLVAQFPPAIGPALWFLKKHSNKGIFDWPLESGMVVGADKDKNCVVLRPIDDEFMAWVQRSAMRELGPTVH